MRFVCVRSCPKYRACLRCFAVLATQQLASERSTTTTCRQTSETTVTTTLNHGTESSTRTVATRRTSQRSSAFGQAATVGRSVGWPLTAPTMNRPTLSEPRTRSSFSKSTRRIVRRSSWLSVFTVRTHPTWRRKATSIATRWKRLLFRQFPMGISKRCRILL